MSARSRVVLHYQIGVAIGVGATQFPSSDCGRRVAERVMPTVSNRGRAVLIYRATELSLES